MPEKQNQSVAVVAPMFFNDDGDDGFGDFKFASFSSSSSAPSPSLLFPNHNYSNQQPEDDEWGDFVHGPFQSHPFKPPISSPLFDPFPSLDNSVQNPDPIHSDAEEHHSSKRWEKPSGALPLSLFGDEEVGESETLDPRILIGDVFSSPATASERQVKDGGLKDLIANLYSQAGEVGAGSDVVGGSDLADEGDDGFDESCWEFKDAFSSDAGVKVIIDDDDVILIPGSVEADSVSLLKQKEERSLEISGSGKKSATGENGIQVVGSRWGDCHEANVPHVISNHEQDMGGMFAAHDGILNGLNFDSNVVAHSNCISDACQQTKDIKTENGLRPSLGNGDIYADENCWDFKDAFSDTEVVTYSLGQQNISGAEVKVLTPNCGIQGISNMWENHLGDLPKSNSDGKENPGGPFGDENGLFYEPTFVRNGIENMNIGPVVALNDIISNLYNKADQNSAVYHTRNPTVDGQNSAESVLNLVVVEDDGNSDEINWEFKEASETTVKDQNYASKAIDPDLSREPIQGIFLDLYSRLKEKSLRLSLRHLGDLKKAHDIAALSGEHAKAMTLDGEIQAAYKMLHEEDVISRNDYMKKQPPEDLSVNELLKDIQETHFRDLELEYHLSERVLAAEKELSSAIELFEHTTSVLRILWLASREEQGSYIIAWSGMALACAQELQNGAMIWAESLRANVCGQILSESQGNRYFVALGEIYRVAEILKASLKLYKPWILSNHVESRNISTSLERCTEAWKESGLEKALESVSNHKDHEHEVLIKGLLNSIKHIRDLGEHALQNPGSGPEHNICKLSLLPFEVLQDMKAVVWNGEQYCLKLANLWANRISSDPPQLRCIGIS